eukprot:s1_g911.t1
MSVGPEPEILSSEVIPGGAHWSLTMKAGLTLSLTDVEGGANVGMLFYNPMSPLERYNAPDSLKCQHTFKLTKGNCLYSDMGRIFCSIVEDTFGWHDTVCGTTTRKIVEEKWGLTTYQTARNERTQNGLDSFLVEAAKYGLGKKDMAANVNWFSKVAPDAEGNLNFVPDAAQAGARVELRFEMDTLVLFHTCLTSSKPSRLRQMMLVAPPARRTAGALRILNSIGAPPVDQHEREDRDMIKESTLDPVNATYRETVEAGDYWMHTVKRGETFRILDLEGNQAADTLFYSADDPTERYSAVDTIREQGNVYLTAGTKLLSTEGSVMLEIVADTCGRHDTLGGACATESNTVRYAHDTKCMHACRDSWLLAVAENEEYGMSKRDITHNINFFMNVPVTPEGGLTFEDGISAPGKYVEMRAEMDVLVLISNCPQLNNPCNAYNPTPIDVLIWDGSAA